MYERKKRGFSFGVNTKHGTELLYVWFSTDEKSRVDCSIADRLGNIMSRGVAVLHDTDEFSTVEGEEVAYTKAINKLYDKALEELNADIKYKHQALYDLKKNLTNKMSHHLVKEKKLDEAFAKKGNVND